MSVGSGTFTEVMVAAGPDRSAASSVCCWACIVAVQRCTGRLVWHILLTLVCFLCAGVTPCVSKAQYSTVSITHVEGDCVQPAGAASRCVVGVSSAVSE